MNDLVSLGEDVSITLFCVEFQLVWSHFKVPCHYSLTLHSPALSPPQGFADRESGSGHEHHPQHLQPDPEVPCPADRTALGQPSGGGSAPQLHCHAAVVQYLQVLLSLPFQRWGLKVGFHVQYNEKSQFGHIHLHLNSVKPFRFLLFDTQIKMTQLSLSLTIIKAK